MAIAPKAGVSAILIKPIRDVEGKVVGLGELVQGDIAIVPGPLEFQDGTQQTTAYIPGEGNVSTFSGRTGAITPQAGDYSAIDITVSPLIGGATEVQGALQSLESSISSVQSGTKFAGTLGFNDADPAKPAAGTTAAPYYIFNTAGTRTVGDASGVKVEVGDWLAYNATTTKWVHLAYSARTQTAKGTSYDPANHRVLKGTDVQTALDQTDTALEILETQVAGINGRNYVNAFNGRSGVVAPADGDYESVQVKHTPSGTGVVTSVNVQGAIDELEQALNDATGGAAGSIQDHINNTTGAHAASAISFAPVAGTTQTVAIAATDVQAAVQEVANKSLPFFDTNGTLKPIKFI